MNAVVLTGEDNELIVAFAGCSLDDSPGKNWVEGVGGLPTYICEIARAIKKTGKTTSEAIAIAVSRVKVWASGKGVDKDTQAKAAKAVAEWEAKKAKSHAKSGAKKSGHALAATAVTSDISDAELLRLASLEPTCEFTAVQKVLMMSQLSAVEQILALEG